MVFQKICEIIAEVLNVDVSELNENTDFVGDLCADSLDVYQIVMMIEEEFGIQLEESVVEKIKTVGEAVAVVEKEMNE